MWHHSKITHGKPKLASLPSARNPAWRPLDYREKDMDQFLNDVCSRIRNAFKLDLSIQETPREEGCDLTLTNQTHPDIPRALVSIRLLPPGDATSPASTGGAISIGTSPTGGPDGIGGAAWTD